MILEVSDFDLDHNSCAVDGPVNSLYPLHSSLYAGFSGMSAVSTGANGQKKMCVQTHSFILRHLCQVISFVV